LPFTSAKYGFPLIERSPSITDAGGNYPSLKTQCLATLKFGMPKVIAVL